MPNIRRQVINLILVVGVLLLGVTAWYLLSGEAMVNQQQQQQQQQQQTRLSVTEDVPKGERITIQTRPIQPEIPIPNLHYYYYYCCCCCCWGR